MKTVEKIKEKPILFSSEMIRALLIGNKTQTRRIIKSIYNKVYEDQGYIHIMDTAGLNEVKFDKDKSVAQFILQTKVDDSDIFDEVKSKYQINDILYVKESYLSNKDKVFMGYLADALPSQIEMTKNKNICTAKWTNPRFMFKKYARIFLKIINIRVERVQDISELDSIAEGIQILDDKEPAFYHDYGTSSLGFRYTARDAYSGLWDKINDKKEDCSWNKNPFVFVYEFEVINK